MSLVKRVFEALLRRAAAYRRRSRPILMRLGGFVVLPLGVLVFFGWEALSGDLPEGESQVGVEGISSEISITRDRLGVPYISAQTDRNVFFATGYLHAQDRLWQLELQRRAVQGRLSEVLGANFIERDVWMRTLGLSRVAESALPALDTQTRDALQGYADGVNAWLGSHKRLPVEFAVLSVVPEPWRPQDSVAVAKSFALSLGGNARREIQRLLATPLLTEAQMASLFPGKQVVDAPEVLERPALLGWSDKEKKVFNGAFGTGTDYARFVGSNAWAVSGKLAEGGGAILANDPHLGLQMPSLWYVLAQSGNNLHAAGMTLVGMPMIVFGQNGDIAWGGTNLMADTQDLFVEQSNPANPLAYRVGDHWESFEMRTELIRVRPPFPAALHSPVEPVKIDVRSTRNGPVISDALGALREPLALRWPALDANDTSVAAMLKIGYAKNWMEFNSALRGYVAPALNFVYADREGNIGYVGAGYIPVRGKGQGGVPVPGWDDAYRWRGVIAFEDLPRKFNPPEGYIVSANQNMLSAGYPLFISNDWLPPSRARRIENLIRERLGKKGRVSSADMTAIQADEVSLPALRLRDLLVAGVDAGDERRTAALTRLKSWQGDMSTGSSAATIFNVWTDHLREKLFGPTLTPGWAQRDQKRILDALSADTTIDDLAHILGDSNNPWCVEKARRGSPDCHTILGEALNETLDELRRLAGKDMDGWAWGKVHHAIYAHTPFSEMKVFDRLFERRAETGGSPDTINVANSTFRMGDGYRQTLGAGFRQVVAFGDGAPRHLFMNSTGQSGNIFSKHYADMLDAFRTVAYESINAAPTGAEIHRICLLPAARGAAKAGFDGLACAK